MQISAQKILITEVSSLLGSSLVSLFLNHNNKVYGVSKSAPKEEILKNPNFSLLDINLSQPLPSHIPPFDLIIHLLPESTTVLKNFSNVSSLTPATNQIINQSRQGTKVILLAPVLASQTLYEYVARDEVTKINLKLFLIGDIYGPNDPAIKEGKSHTEHFYNHNELTTQINQAINSDKIILEDEGLRTVFPTYIDDAISAFDHFISDPNSKIIRVIVSQEPKTALSCAYEIQKVSHINLNRELKLFFSGPEKNTQREPHPVIHPNALGYNPKFNLEDGLKKTLDYYKKNDHTISLSPTEPPVVQKVEYHAPKGRLSILNRLHIKKFTSKIPATRFGFNNKKIILAVLILFTLTIFKTGLDLYLGISSLKSARQSLLSGDLQVAKDRASSASSSFGAAGSKINFLTYPFSLVMPGKTTAIVNAVSSAQLGSNAVANFTDGAQELAKDLQKITTNSTKNGTLDTQTPIANLKKAYLNATQAYQLATLAQKGGLFTSQLSTAHTVFKDLANFSSSTLELISFITDVTGTSGETNYLVLLQNNTELRPGGGFIGSFGEITFENGHLSQIAVEDIYAIDGQLKEEIEPPPQLTDKLGVEQLFLRDSNWSTDFSVNAATARDFYKKETGKDVDGVIALDLTFIQNILAEIGPIHLEDYNEDITAENLFERGEYHSEIGFFPGSTQKREFFSTLTRAVIAKITDNLAAGTKVGDFPWLELVTTTRKGLATKHLMLASDSDNLSTLVKTKSWNNPLPPVYFDVADDSLGTRDFLALSEANLGANKVNRFIDRNIEYEMTIGRDADLVAKLKITYTNTAQANTWPAGTYVNFLRVYTPFASGLFDYQNGQSDDLEEVEVTQEGNLTVFSTFVEVPIKQSKSIEFTYRIPKNIKLEQAPTYHLFVSKQPGTIEDPFTFIFNLPDYIEIKTVNNVREHEGDQNLIIEGDLEADRQFEIEVVKK